MARKNPLRHKLKRFGTNFVDSVVLPDLEFHLGVVSQVINNKQDVKSLPSKLQYKFPKNPSGGILIKSKKGALPTFPRKVTAIPLLRGISDSVAKGDLVIFCNIGDQTYYLGPINTTNQTIRVPANESPLTQNRLDQDKTSDDTGYSYNFPKPLIHKQIGKLQKSWIHNTDYPNDSVSGIRGSIPYHEGSFSDVVLDGRFGNSIRIGSRNAFPILNIHNGRIGSTESLSVGSLISMTSFGSFNDNWRFNQDFKLASDRRIEFEKEGLAEGQYPGYLINFGNDEIDDGVDEQTREDKFDYNWGSISRALDHDAEEEQMILFSDRIVFDSRKTDLTFSAYRNINFGAGRNLTITNKGFSVIESENIYIGKESKNKAQPMVLGDELRELLLEIMTILQDSRALVQGVPLPLYDQTSQPMFTRIQDVINALQPREVDDDTNSPKPGSGGGTRFLSQYHYIEQNYRS